MAAKKILIVFYSRSGTTRRVAETIAAELRCDVEEISDRKSRAGFFGIMRSVIEAARQRPAPIAPTRLNPSSYDLVVVGTPVWAWSVSSPVRTYLMEHGPNLPQVAFFCTLGNRGSESAFAQMQEVAGKPPHAKAAFKTRDVVTGLLPSQLTEFVQALGS
jgi:flavodoxin